MMATETLCRKTTLLVLALLAFLSCASLPQTDTHPAVSMMVEPAEGFRVEEGFVGSSVEIPAPGKVTVLDFWATWCEPCIQRIIPGLEAIWLRVDRTQVAVIGVSIDKGENVDALMRKTLAEEIPTKVTFPMVLDGSAATFENAYKVRGTVPATFVIDKKGRVRFYFSGADGDMARIEQAIRALVEE